MWYVPALEDGLNFTRIQEVFLCFAENWRMLKGMTESSQAFNITQNCYSIIHTISND